MKVQERLFAQTQKLEKNQFVRTLRGALLSLIPVLMIGAFALVGRSFPIPAYQTFIWTFGDGLIETAFHMIHSATFGMLSVTLLYDKLYRLFKLHKHKLYSDGADSRFNASVSSIPAACFSDFIAETVSKYEVGENRFCLEVTEQNAFIVNDAMDEVMNRIKGRGVLFAIDDFSMGQTDFNQVPRK